MFVPVWMPQKPALAVICASWVAAASLTAYLHARATERLPRSTAANPANQNRPSEASDVPGFGRQQTTVAKKV
jgi:hypothetical protein